MPASAGQEVDGDRTRARPGTWCRSTSSSSAGWCCTRARSPRWRTGEGKTLVATMPLYLNALAKQGAHLVTVNDYLARRDREWMGPVYESLGLTVGCIQQGMEPTERKPHYSARHHLRHEQRVRVRLPARQHGRALERQGAARASATPSWTRLTSSWSTRRGRRSSSRARSRPSDQGFDQLDPAGAAARSASRACWLNRFAAEGRSCWTPANESEAGIRLLHGPARRRPRTRSSLRPSSGRA